MIAKAQTLNGKWVEGKAFYDSIDKK